MIIARVYRPMMRGNYGPTNQEQFARSWGGFIDNFDVFVVVTSCSDAYRCRDLAIFVMIGRQTDGQNRLLYPAHVCITLCLTCTCGVTNHKEVIVMNTYQL